MDGQFANMSTASAAGSCQRYSATVHGAAGGSPKSSGAIFRPPAMASMLSGRAPIIHSALRTASPLRTWAGASAACCANSPIQRSERSRAMRTSCASQSSDDVARGLLVLRRRQVGPVQRSGLGQRLQRQRGHDRQRLPVLPRRAAQQRGPGLGGGVGGAVGAVFLQARQRLALSVVAGRFQRRLPVGVGGQQFQYERGAGLVTRGVGREQLAQHEQRPARGLLGQGGLAIDLLDLGHEEAHDRRVVDGQQVGHGLLMGRGLEEQLCRRGAMHLEHAQPRGAGRVEAGAVAAIELEAVAQAALGAQQSTAMAAGPVVEAGQRFAHALGPADAAVGLRVQAALAVVAFVACSRLRFATHRHAILPRTDASGIVGQGRAGKKKRPRGRPNPGKRRSRSGLLALKQAAERTQQVFMVAQALLRHLAVRRELVDERGAAWSRASAAAFAH
jgi:hypothetical protein